MKVTVKFLITYHENINQFNPKGGANSPQFHFSPWSSTLVKGQVDQHHCGAHLTA